jgi:hypothetical protein
MIIILSVFVAVNLKEFVSLPEFPLNSLLECIPLKSGNSFQKLSVFSQNNNYHVSCYTPCLVDLLGWFCDSSGRVPALINMRS